MSETLVGGFREEPMSGSFTKFHLDGPWPFQPVMHRFADVDHGDPHDHPWGFRSMILWGGYAEEIYDPHSGVAETVLRSVGDSFDVPAQRIHRIVWLPKGECWTLILPGPWERVSRFWQFRPDGPWSRAWNEIDWTKKVQ